MKKILNKFEGFTIWSDENYKELAKWYEEVFGLKKVLELEQPLDYCIAFEIEEGSEMYLWIGYHSEVKGKNKDNKRLMVSFWVDDVYKLSDYLRKKGAEVIAGPDKSPDGSLKFLTIADPENNMIQLFSN